VAGCTGNQSQGDGGEGGTDGGEGGTNGGDGGSSDDDLLVYGNINKPSSIDPHKVSDELEAIIAHNIYDPLLYYTGDTPAQTKPWLAEEYEVSDDNQAYTFYLRDDATFHNGDDVTAEDVAFSIERLMTMKQGFSYMFEGVLEPDAATVVDETTVDIELSSTYAPFAATLPFLFIANKNQIEENMSSNGEYGEMGDYATAWLEENAAGSGPWVMTERNRQSNLKHEKHDDWWGEFADGNSFERLNIELIPETSTMAGLVREGDVHITDRYLPISIFEQLDQRDDVNVSTETTFTPMYIFMHNQRPPFDDINVRRAMAHAFDYEELLNGIMNGDSAQLQGPLPAAMWGHNDELEMYSKDLDRARELLDESQYSDEEIGFTYVYVTGLNIRENIGLMLQSNLNEIGINMEVTNEPWSRITSLHQNIEESPQMIATNLSFNYADPDNFLYPAWHSSSHGSWQSGSWYANDEVDQLLDEAREVVDQDERASLYQDAQQILNEDLPALWAMNQATRYAIREEVEGFVDNGVTGYIPTPHRLSKSS
jgi:peptide/nickel transport system substrate-binding protein